MLCKKVTVPFERMIIFVEALGLVRLCSTVSCCSPQFDRAGESPHTLAPATALFRFNGFTICAAFMALARARVVLLFCYNCYCYDFL